MKKIMLLLMLAVSFVWAELRQVDASEAIVKSGIQIVDIRTKPEWQETGVIKDSILITFFDEQGRYDVQAFMNELNKHVTKDKEFALICRTGNRTSMVSEFLSKQGYKVINLQGGIKRMISQGYAPSAYKP